MGKQHKNVLVTGAAGFAGSHLVDHLLGTGCRVTALDRADAPTANLAEAMGRIEYLPCDLMEEGGQLEEQLRGREFDAVYHLAGLASVRRSWDDVRQTLKVNALGTLNLMGALLRQRTPPALLLVGSAEEYGEALGGGAATVEDAPLAPVSPYALSKVWQESLGAYYARVERWPVYFTRTFNHTGPRQSPDFVCSDFARQIARIELRLQDPVLHVGNLGASRDFLDVRDVVAAYRLVLEEGRPGVPYNVASGTVWKIADLLQVLLQHAVIKIKVEVDLTRRRTTDVPQLWGDPGRLRADTGWAPRVGVEEMLRDLLEHWRREAGAEAETAPRKRGPAGTHTPS
jgi:GDP-4-dehydro-6-deoxy-D-mannose reductase